MLIYNFQKEFIGIDEADLEVFGYANLSELKAESSDFADMFVRTPGYIHNFKHVHWIDFVTCADPSEQSKVIIEVNSKTFKAIINVETIYLSDSPTSKAYLIHLNNLRTLTLKENGDFSEDIARKKPPRIEPTVGHAFNIPEEEEEKVETQAAPELEGFKPFEEIHEIQDTKEIEDTQEIEIFKEEQKTAPKAPLDISFDDDDLDDSIFAQDKDKPTQDEVAKTETPDIEIEDSLSIDSLSLELDDIGFEDDEKPIEAPQAATEEEDDDFDYSYTYNPQVASDELGLPVDLIEEFIQDFIAQAKEFKDELYSSLDDTDLDNIQILSHKLKGVAANLRIEDAFNTLGIINTSSDVSEVGKYLNIFYKIIAKLSGEEIQAAKPAQPEPTEAEPVEIAEEVNSSDSNKDTKSTDLDEPEELNLEVQTDEEDDLVLDFKEYEKEEETPKEKEIELEDDLILDFKEDKKREETPKEQKIEIDLEDDDDDLYLDFDIGTEDNSKIPQKIEISEIDDIDDIDDFLSIGEEIEDVEKEETQELLDIKYAKERVANEIGLDKESFDEIFEDYIQDSKSSVTAIREAISKDDFSKCRKEAIKLKGMSDNMRVDALKDSLTSLISSTDKDELTQAIKKIDAVIAQISK